MLLLLLVVPAAPTMVLQPRTTMRREKTPPTWRLLRMPRVYRVPVVVVAPRMHQIQRLLLLMLLLRRC